MAYDMRSYASEVMQRLDKYEVARKLDYGTLESLINLARLDVQNATLQALPERYARRHRVAGTPALSLADSARILEYDVVTQGARSIVNRVFTLNLPEDFIDEVAVGIEYNGAIWPARNVSKRDLHTVLTKSFARPSRYDPIYCIEKQVGTAQTKILVSIGPDTPDVASIEIWYLAKLPWLQISTTTGADVEVRIGADLQELVVLLACQKVITALSLPGTGAIVRNDIDLMLKIIEQQYKGKVDRSRLLVEARESTVPQQPKVDVNATR